MAAPPKAKKLPTAIIAVAVVGLLLGFSLGYYVQLGAIEEAREAARVQLLTRLNVPVEIPLSRGLAEGGEVFYITTEASDKALAEALAEKTGFRVVFTPAIAKAPETSLADMYVFTNGIKGTGFLGFQPEVFDSVPGEAEYSPAWMVEEVAWKAGVKPRELKSSEDVDAAEAAGEVAITQTGIVVNCPIVKWPGGQMKLETRPITDETPYGGAQAISIDTDAMKVTFKAHRGWGPDGSSIFYIVTDASDKAAADDMGVIFAPKTRDMLVTAATSDLFQFTNGIKGSGPLGFQSGIGATIPGQEPYSPYWRIQAITWKDQARAVILESLGDIGAVGDSITVEPMMGGLVVNCPFVAVA